MSKVSEWAEETARANTHIASRPRLDQQFCADGGHLIIQTANDGALELWSGGCWRMLEADQALELARWILDTFSEEQS